MIYSTFIRKKFNSIKRSPLPSQYQAVEYIESTGTQYIDTGIIPTQNSYVEIVASINEQTTNSVLFGSRNGRAELSFTVFDYVNGYNFRTDYGNLYSATFKYEIGTKYRIVKDKNVTNFYNMDNVVLKSFTIAEQTFTSPNYLVLFGCNNATTVNLKTKAKIYSCKMKYEDKLIRNFIPCYRKSDDVIGMFDTITSTFVRNGGTGVFLKGPDIKL